MTYKNLVTLEHPLGNQFNQYRCLVCMKKISPFRAADHWKFCTAYHEDVMDTE